MMHDTYTREEVVQSLETVLKDAKFAAAPQMSAFLRFVVMQTLDGKADRIKAYTVAVDALGKPPTFDPQNDPSVRVLAKRLRDTLAAYYQRTSGHTLVLLLRSGSYIPSFVSVEFAEESRLQSKVTPLTSVTPTVVKDRNEITYGDRTSVKTNTLDSVYGATNKLAKR